MATSGTITLSTSGNLEGKIDWTVSGTTVTAKLYAKKKSTTTGTTSGKWSGYVKIGSTQVNINSSTQIYVAQDWVLMASASATCTSNVTVSGSITGPSNTTLSGKTSSGSATVTVASYVTINSFTTTANGELGITINWEVSGPIDYLWYSLDNGASWTARGSVNNTTSGVYTISSGLSAGTSYNCKIRVRSTASQLTTDSSTSSCTTYSYPYVNSWPGNFTMDAATKTLTFKFYNPLSRSITYKFTFGNYSASGTTTGTSATLSFSSSSGYAQMTTASSKSITYTATATGLNASGTATVYGSSSYAGPKITSSNFKYNIYHNKDILSGLKKLVQGYSYLKIYSSGDIGTPSQGATISSTTFTFGGKSQSVTSTETSFQSDMTFSYTTSTAGTITVKDSRGFTATATVTISCIGYSSPTAIISAVRTDGYGEEVKITGNASYTSLDNYNSISAYYWKVGSDGEWTELDSSTRTVETTLDIDKSQTYYLKVVDAIGNESKAVSATVSIGQPIVFLDTSTEGVGINSYPTGKGLYVPGGQFHYQNVANVGSDTADTAGWYKVAESTMGGYGNISLVYLVKENHPSGIGGTGILEIVMRCHNTTVSCWSCSWLARRDCTYITRDMIRISITGMTWTMYVKRSQRQWGRLSFYELYHTDIDGGFTNNYYPITYFDNNNIPETTEPTATVTSTDGGALMAYPVGSIYMSVESTSPASMFGGSWTQISGYYLYAGTSGGTTGGSSTSGAASGNTDYTTLSAAQSGLPAHNHGASGSFEANFYIRHGTTSNTQSVAAGTNTSVTQNAYSDTWGNGFSTSSYSHKPDKVSIEGSVGVSISNNEAKNASEGHRHGLGSHTHSIEPPYYTMYVWKRTA